MSASSKRYAGAGAPQADPPSRKQTYDPRLPESLTIRSFSERWVALSEERTGLLIGTAPSPKWLNAWGLSDDLSGAKEFCSRLLDCAAQVSGFKAQTPFFERFGPGGLELLEWFFRHCADVGSLAIADAKRTDAGDTMAAYADLYLGTPSALRADAVTLAPFLGIDVAGPLFRIAYERSCAVIVLVRTSNHEAYPQLARGPGGRTVSEQLADRITELNSLIAPGQRFGPVAALVGTGLSQAQNLAHLMPNLRDAVAALAAELKAALANPAS